MLHLASPAGRVRSALSLLFAALALILLCTGAARADTWTNGQLTTYSQVEWVTNTNALGLINNDFNSIYLVHRRRAGSGDTRGTAGFSMLFSRVKKRGPELFTCIGLGRMARQRSPRPDIHDCGECTVGKLRHWLLMLTFPPPALSLEWGLHFGSLYLTRLSMVAY